LPFIAGTTPLPDEPGDPHSPVIFGIERVLLQGYELYVAAARDPKMLANYGRGTPDHWLERNLYSRFQMLGVSVFVVLQLTVLGVPAITVSGPRPIDPSSGADMM
jgi:stearoyl-CoA desaturase (delta-9 desaturase)